MDRYAGYFLAEPTMDLVAPVDDSVLRPFLFFGFKQRAVELSPMVQQRGDDAGIGRFLVIDH
jgi:hypothetical protein